MHGQWDWMNDPQIHSSTWDWDTASTAEAWKHSHNYVHHTTRTSAARTGISATRSCGSTRTRSGIRSTCSSRSTTCCWRRSSSGASPLHDLDFEAIRTGEKSRQAELKRHAARGIVRQGAPARSSRTTSLWPWAARWPPCLGARRAAGALADARSPRQRRLGRTCTPQRLVLRDHLLRPLPRPDLHFSQEEVEDETRAAGTSASCSARPTSRAARCSTCASGNLGYQVEHHLFPDMPSTRYAEIAPRVRGRCARSTACRTTPGRCTGSTARPCARS